MLCSNDAVVVSHPQDNHPESGINPPAGVLQNPPMGGMPTKVTQRFIPSLLIIFLATSLVVSTEKPAHAQLPPPRVIKGHTNEVRAVAFSPDSKLLATGSYDKTIRIWEVATGQRKDRLPHNSEVYGLAFSPDGKTLTSGDKDGSITLWDVATGEKKKAIAKAWTSPVVWIRFAPDGDTLGVFGEGSQSPAFYSLTNNEFIVTLKGHTDTVNALEFSPDGKIVATVSNDSSIRLWDPITGTEKDSLKAHDGPVNCLAFSPDGKRLATGGRDKTVIVWDLKTGNVIKPVLEDHNWEVLFVGYLPDGRILTRTLGYGVRIWEPSKDKAMILQKDLDEQKDYRGASLKFQQQFMRSTLFGYFALSPDGTTCAAAGSCVMDADKSNVHITDISKFLMSKE